MAVKPRLTKDEHAALPEPLKLLYKAKDDGFTIDIEGGYVPPEFRENNRALNTKVTDLEGKLKVWTDLGVEIETVKTALASQGDAKTAEQLATAEAALANERTAHAASELRHQVGFAFLRFGGQESALDFMVHEASKVFKLVDGKLVTDSASIKTPGAKLSIDEWLAAQQTSAAFAFKVSKGAGATGSIGRAPERRTIDATDPLAVGRNLEAIAKGEVGVA